MATNYKKWEALDRELAADKDEEDLAKERLKDLRDDLSEKEHRRLHECWRGAWRRVRGDGRLVLGDAAKHTA